MEPAMEKLLAKFAANKSAANARAVSNYAKRHPMAIVLLVPDEVAIYREAKKLALAPCSEG
jgi:hypothetical protein